MADVAAFVLLLCPVQEAKTLMRSVLRRTHILRIQDTVVPQRQTCILIAEKPSYGSRTRSRGEMHDNAYGLFLNSK